MGDRDDLVFDAMDDEGEGLYICYSVEIGKVVFSELQMGGELLLEHAVDGGDGAL